MKEDKDALNNMLLETLINVARDIRTDVREVKQLIAEWDVEKKVVEGISNEGRVIELELRRKKDDS